MIEIYVLIGLLVSGGGITEDEKTAEPLDEGEDVVLDDSSDGLPTDVSVGTEEASEVKAQESEEVSAEPTPVTETFEATAYVATCEGCIGITKTGVDVRSTQFYEGKRVIAVDPTQIPLGSTVEVKYADGTSFVGTAQDVGSAIQGKRIDILVESVDEALGFGRQSVEVHVVN